MNAFAMVVERQLLIASVFLSLSMVQCVNKTFSYDGNAFDPPEYCNGETFRPRCPSGKTNVILILAARYGRMSFGRCLVNVPFFANMADNPQFVGCSHDVKHILDQRCSGLSECDVRINDQTFDGVQPCFAGLKMHLEPSYVCVQVAAESRHCTVTLTTEPQHIVGGSRSRLIQSDTVGCGAKSQPWSVEAMAGQRIAVSLIDFERSTENVSDSLTIGCRPSYGYLVDRNLRHNVSICGNGLVQHGAHRADATVIFTSSSNLLQVVTEKASTHKFLLRLEAVGCSDLAPPSDSAWLKRVDDQITVGCYMSRQSWQLNCVNGVWTGTVGVCNETPNNEFSSKDAESNQRSAELKIGQSTSIAALTTIAGVGVSLCCLVICIGLLCLHRQQKVIQKKQCAFYNSADKSTCRESTIQNLNL